MKAKKILIRKVRKIKFTINKTKKTVMLTKMAPRTIGEIFSFLNSDTAKFSVSYIGFIDEICSHPKDLLFQSCKDNLSFHFREWKEIGFLKATDYIEYNRYILARKNFRKAVKSAQNKKLYKKYINIERLKNTNPQKFWSKFRSLKKDTNSRLLTINNKQNKEDITVEFANHFEHLLTTPRVTNNNNRKPQIIPPITEATNITTLSTDDVKQAISKLKTNKSQDSFNITAEHLKYSKCKDLNMWLTEFYNYLLKSGSLPNPYQPHS